VKRIMGGRVVHQVGVWRWGTSRSLFCVYGWQR
jgi:hypothetical protein